jgi:hypothetical protein
MLRFMSPILKERLISTGVQLAIIAGVWFAMKLYLWVVLPLAGAVVLPLVFPYRFERIVAGVALIGVAAFFYFYGGAGYVRMCALLAIIGVVMIVYGAVKLRKPELADGAS